MKSTFTKLLAASSRSSAEKLAEKAYTTVSEPVDKIQAAYYNLRQIAGEEHVVTLQARSMHTAAAIVPAACLELWEITADEQYAERLVESHTKGVLMFQTWA
ncbi:hypothetical protein CYLTODRAFT_447890 [Cylindrobasidium torrendii FP15055 ss-10]|uniref:Uncharacterized protein n=1 Tax=Cylindrobasidium torrendii FP15055 ss-10 TaxID=1314674 RepID=A0A0D7ARD8_9AGAR|nr:hypothetical protein CYLTODRAFT_447890 [Cylindrobasidium torrendii FP15055 ss-10]